MKTHCLTFGKRGIGRPPVIEITPPEMQEIQANFLKANRTKKDGSMLLAWVRFCEARPVTHGHLVRDHMPATTIPSAVVEACRQIRPLIGPDRGGAARLRHESAYVPGTMRRHHAMQRRLMAGDRASVDDATRNVACWIPWPWGGCPCSEKYGVRLGRWQTLVIHDDASSFIPFVSSVFRWQQSYRATDAAAAIYRAERDVIQFDNWSIEGGVWQAKRTLAVLGGRFISAKGRPNQKLVENYFGRLWTIMAGQPGDVGRHRAEILKNSELYLKSRQGLVDPRDHFMSLTEAQNAMYASIDYLNEKRMNSRTYGQWIPKERWENDLAESARSPRPDADDFLILPVAETRVVSGDSVSIKEEGPLGIPMTWKFTADWLWQYRGRRVTAYFDPLAEWPVQATLTLEGQRKPLGIVECLNPMDNSKDRATEMVAAVRKTMMTETRILAKNHTERIVRHPSGIIASSTAPAAEVTAAPSEIHSPERGESLLVSLSPRSSRETLVTPPRASREDVSDRLSRRAAKLRGEVESPARQH